MTTDSSKYVLVTGGAGYIGKLPIPSLYPTFLPTNASAAH